MRYFFGDDALETVRNTGAFRNGVRGCAPENDCMISEAESARLYMRMSSSWQFVLSEVSVRPPNRKTVPESVGVFPETVASFFPLT